MKPPQRPEPEMKNNRVQWSIHTAMTVSQLKLAYQKSGEVYATLELHVDMANDIKSIK